MFALIMTISLNLQGYPLFNLGDGQPVYMRTTTFRVAVGQFATKAECEAYAGYQDFTLAFTDGAGHQYKIPVTPTAIDGCAQVL
jgi:hypothetical protein